jgi:prolyl-tRNA synthetase
VANDHVCTLVIDSDARNVVNAVTGANQGDHHVKGFNWSREVKSDVLGKAVVADVRNVMEGDLAPNAGRSPLKFRKAIEIGHVFKLGTKYSEAMGATFLDEQGKPHSLIMGCYGIGVNRILAAAIEAHHDNDGIRWPLNIAPFQVLIVALDINDEAVMSTARRLYDALESQGVEVLLDDRDQRPGFKFKDADLIGIPIRVTVGKKALAEGQVELKMRGGADVEKLSPEKIVDTILERLKG